MSIIDWWCSSELSKGRPAIDLRLFDNELLWIGWPARDRSRTSAVGESEQIVQLVPIMDFDVPFSKKFRSLLNIILRFESWLHPMTMFSSLHRHQVTSQRRQRLKLLRIHWQECLLLTSIDARSTLLYPFSWAWHAAYVMTRLSYIQNWTDSSSLLGFTVWSTVFTTSQCFDVLRREEQRLWSS